jgi:hypothetical protein
VTRWVPACSNSSATQPNAYTSKSATIITFLQYIIVQYCSLIDHTHNWNASLLIQDPHQLTSPAPPSYVGHGYMDLRCSNNGCPNSRLIVALLRLKVPRLSHVYNMKVQKNTTITKVALCLGDPSVSFNNITHSWNF